VRNNKFLLIAMLLVGISNFGCAELEQAHRSQVRADELMNQLNRSREEETIPMPESWKFPQVIESARAISPNNEEGKSFNRFGLVYTLDELAKLTLSSMSAEELQKYADIVTHAYPDAVARGFPPSCNDLPIEKLDETAVAGLAYISINALNEDTRNKASVCLVVIQKKLSQHGR